MLSNLNKAGQRKVRVASLPNGSCRNTAFHLCQQQTDIGGGSVPPYQR